MSWLRKTMGRLRPRPLWSGYPSRTEIDADALDQTLGLPAPTVDYVMFFTPRSGSTWVANLMTQSKRLGQVTEAFNPNFLPKMTRSANATDLQTYCQALRRLRARAGTFGFQITDHQMRAVFGDADRFLQHFDCQNSIWLIRRDIVAQGVSLYKMQVTKISHAPKTDAEALTARERVFQYNAAEIRRWIEHIRTAERGTETLLEVAGLTPLRMSYEHNQTLKPNHIVNVIGHHLGLPTMRMKLLQSPHKKIGTDLNAQFAQRFREEHPDYIAQLDAERAPMLDKIVYYGPRRPATP